MHMGEKLYTSTDFGNMWVTLGVRCMKHVSSYSIPGPRLEPGTFGSVDECSTTELPLLLSFAARENTRNFKAIPSKSPLGQNPCSSALDMPWWLDLWGIVVKKSILELKNDAGMF